MSCRRDVPMPRTELNRSLNVPRRASNTKILFNALGQGRPRSGLWSITMKRLHRQFLNLARALVALAASCYVASAQTYPTRPITLVVPVAAGGGVDTAARILSEKLQEKLKQPVTVENRPGAGSMIGASFVAKAPADGQT